MTNLSQNYFSIGEFAKLLHISKQTLFYYEKNNIINPALIQENGYRYYSLDQYFIFEIIINLRKLGIPLKDIAFYLKNRDINTLQKFYKEKQKEYITQINILQRNIKSLDTKINHLEKIKSITTDRITLEEHNEEYYINTPFPQDSSSLKNKITLVAKHNFPFFDSEILNEYLLGYILPKDKLLQEKYLAISDLYTRISAPEEYLQYKIKAAGLYASIYALQGFHEKYFQAFQKLIKFINRNELCIIGDAFIEQYRNYWSTPKYNDYIVKIMIPVDYK